LEDSVPFGLGLPGVPRSLATRRATKAGAIGTGPGKEEVKGTESPAGLLLQLQNG
jgi:hypothetical protein